MCFKVLFNLHHGDEIVDSVLRILDYPNCFFQKKNVFAHVTDLLHETKDTSTEEDLGVTILGNNRF